VPEQNYVPLYDHAGNLSVLTGAAGLPIEKYRYAPFGPAAIEVDAVAPQVTQARVLDQEFVIECSEGLTEEALLRGLAEGAFQITVDEELLSLGLPLGVVAGEPAPGPRRRPVRSKTRHPPSQPPVPATSASASPSSTAPWPAAAWSSPSPSRPPRVPP
jgi:hypothetical protein